MADGTGISVKGRQVIAQNVKSYAALSIAGVVPVEYRYRATVGVELVTGGISYAGSTQIGEIWYQGVHFEDILPSDGIQKDLVAYWKESGLPYEWFAGD